MELIEAIQVHTVEGFKVKALASFWCHSGGKIDFDAAATDLQLAADVINDLPAV
ncbi:MULTISPECIES: hypothetical protein [Rhizobium]|uniref:hypothetical protein n=1 Tax=Rhizobium TaxID=379 RepID=UPI00041D11CF|nr:MULTISPECIES: hypothetical protein [Rhizobium]MCA0804380.1 hypothetical protein [Rhizobium sp. T1473]MCS0459615.1 hypothetical protein [Rhizobium favelukesii]UFS80251.1 hypothetical protein LPB79_03030 [Rhizobium sp. T136]